MQLISVNVGQVTPIENAGKSGKTGIFKQPMSGPVQINELGLEHDAIVDTENHGGVDQAVYVFGQPDYVWWSNEIGRELAPGTFGENLTISDLESATFKVGDRLQVGDKVILQVTSPRIPCSTLAARMGDPQFVKRFRHGERPGLYCRVLQTGTVQTGDAVTVIPYEGETLSAIEMFRTFYENTYTQDYLRRAVAAPIAIRDKEHFRQLLQDL